MKRLLGLFVVFSLLVPLEGSVVFQASPDTSPYDIFGNTHRFETLELEIKTRAILHEREKQAQAKAERQQVERDFQKGSEIIVAINHKSFELSNLHLELWTMHREGKTDINKQDEMKKQIEMLKDEVEELWKLYK